ncbi:MAG: hydantoinase/oxoprolinase family protein [Deltaproteobacteria bacterium]|nr:hydantoinase/oxoprolinase family protein [Deltaproteobacteria bacterium]MBW2072267.1 hydantoinase/oxoprolinase family protein [Deltaproteobacteria bacterium]
MILGLDVGGTHTDVVVIDGDQVVGKTKMLTDEDNLIESVCFSILECTGDLDPQDIQRVVVSTTLATNAIVQKRMPPVGIVVVSGPGMNPDEYRIGEHYYPVTGAVDHRGMVIQAIDPQEIDILRTRLKNAGVERVAVVGKFSTRNPAQEQEIAHLLADAFPTVVMGHSVSGQLNFPRRIATAYLNAAVAPMSGEFYRAVQTCMERRGLMIQLEILKADGGTMAQERSLQYAVETILSGPAASIMGALPHADPHREEIVLDIGGTTTDMAVLVGGVPLLEPRGISIGGYKTLVRALRTCSIGVGGDSWVRLEKDRLEIGPERKGRAVAYGGPEPTPTDALITLGAATGGHRQRAAEAMRRLGYQLKTGVEETAAMVVEKTCSLIMEGVGRMVDSINQQPVYTIHELLEGRQISPEGLIIIGGPAEELALPLQSMSGWSVKVPPHHEVANAIGAAIARTTCEVTVVADTEKGYVCVPEEDYVASIDRQASTQEVIDLAFGLLKSKAFRLGADEDDLEMELLEVQEFNMVRGFSTVGKNIRVRTQIKPGLISHYREAAA